MSRAPNYRTVPGVYWETRWLAPHSERLFVHSFRPCENGLARFFKLPPGRRFKVCFLRCDGKPAPWAYATRYPASLRDPIRHPHYAAEILTVEGCVYSFYLRRAGFQPTDPVQWWIEYEEEIEE